MDLSQALQNIKRVADAPPIDEVRCIRENKEEAIPLLINFVSDSIKTFRNLLIFDESVDDPTFALFLLAEFGVNEAFPLFAEILELEDDKADWILSDVLSDGMGAMTASVATENDIDRIKAIIGNIEINEFQRLAAVDALIGLYARGVYSRNDLIADFRHLLETYQKNDDFLDYLVDKCLEVEATELYELIRKLFVEEKVYEIFVGIEDFAEDAPVRSEDEVIASLMKHSAYGEINDMLMSVIGWTCFNNDDFDDDIFDSDDIIDDDSVWIPPSMFSTKNTPIVNPPKIGRNEPCPCGSGQKYKRCCGK
ncbi:MAG: DUF1186 domain-containing protein [Defluviitaleaceae bacterium]|nr:DUF1186 domain-containing protein [Defluviitaleaceae bacterium]